MGLMAVLYILDLTSMLMYLFFHAEPFGHPASFSHIVLYRDI